MTVLFHMVVLPLVLSRWGVIRYYRCWGWCWDVGILVRSAVARMPGKLGWSGVSVLSRIGVARVPSMGSISLIVQVLSIVNRCIIIPPLDCSRMEDWRRSTSVLRFSNFVPYLLTSMCGSTISIAVGAFLARILIVVLLRWRSNRLSRRRRWSGVARP